MKCPHCDTDLGEGLLPARCPACGANLSPGRGGHAAAAQHSRLSVEGLSGVGKGNKKDRPRYIGRSIIAFLLVALFCVGLYFVVTRFIDVNSGLPDVVGWRVERAQDKLEEAGYSVKVVEAADPTSHSGLVTAQDPPAGAKADKGALITLTVAKARTMPDLVGQAETDAIAALDDLGIAHESVYEPSDEADGTVLSTSLVAGVEVPNDMVCELTVAKTPVVPDLSKMSKDEAMDALQKAGLVGQFEPAKPKDGQAMNTVVSQEPAAGTQLKVGGLVKVTITSPKSNLAKDTAEQIISIVYNTDPSGDAIGAKLIPLLSPSSPYYGKSAHEVGYGLVKGGGKHQDIDEKIQSLQRSISSMAVEMADDGLSATAEVHVNWDWSRFGTDYAGVTSSDTHYVTMTFDDEGRLVSFSDPQTDVPAYEVQATVS